MTYFYDRIDPVIYVIGFVLINIFLPFVCLSYFGYSLDSDKELENNTTKKDLIKVAYFNLTVISVILMFLFIIFLSTYKK